MADDGQKKLAEIIGKCWKDGAFKQRFMADPKAVLKEHSIDVPADVQVKVVENTGNQLYITLPPAPDSAGRSLSDAQLEAVSGGVIGAIAGKYSAYRVFSRQIIATTQGGGVGSTCYNDCIPW